VIDYLARNVVVIVWGAALAAVAAVSEWLTRVL
jgi:hypothetical protein